MSFKSILDQVVEHFKAGLPMVVYSLPGTGRITAMFASEAELHSTLRTISPGFLFSPFDSDSNKFVIPFAQSEIVEGRQPEGYPKQPLKGENRSEDQGYIALISKAVSAIQSGVLEKVVVSRKQKLELSSFSLDSLLRSLFTRFEEAFRYFWYHPETGIWCGATPELLLRVSENKFNTMALAGTREHTANGRVYWSKKERTEQQFVTDYILAALQPHATDISTIGPYNQAAGSLVHLRTNISGSFLPELDMNHILTSLHPTPAVCGTPRKEAIDFIRRYETYDREFYCGYLGFLAEASEETRLYVNLRCMKIEDSHASIYTGGGITAESVPEKEWIETCNKQRTMLKVLSEFL